MLSSLFSLVPSQPLW